MSDCCLALHDNTWHPVGTTWNKCRLLPRDPSGWPYPAHWPSLASYWAAGSNPLLQGARVGVGGLRCGCVFPVRLAEPGYADKKCPAAPGVRSVRGPLGEPLFISTPLCISQELVLARESSNNPWLSLNCEAVHCAADSSALSHHSLVHYLTCAARPIVGTYYK